MGQTFSLELQVAHKRIISDLKKMKEEGSQDFVHLMDLGDQGSPDVFITFDINTNRKDIANLIIQFQRSGNTLSTSRYKCDELFKINNRKVKGTFRKNWDDEPVLKKYLTEYEFPNIEIELHQPNHTSSYWTIHNFFGIYEYELKRVETMRRAVHRDLEPGDYVRTAWGGILGWGQVMRLEAKRVLVRPLEDDGGEGAEVWFKRDEIVEYYAKNVKKLPFKLEWTPAARSAWLTTPEISEQEFSTFVESLPPAADDADEDVFHVARQPDLYEQKQMNKDIKAAMVESLPPAADDADEDVFHDARQPNDEDIKAGGHVGLDMRAWKRQILSQESAQGQGRRNLAMRRAFNAALALARRGRGRRA